MRHVATGAAIPPTRRRAGAKRSAVTTPPCAALGEAAPSLPMPTQTSRRIVALLALCVIAGGRVVAQTGQTSLPASFTAFAVSPGGARSSAVASQVDITGHEPIARYVLQNLPAGGRLIVQCADETEDIGHPI